MFNRSEDLDDYTIKEICYALRKPTPQIRCHLSSCENEILHPSDLGTTLKTLMVFDDLVCVRNQDLMAEYFVLGRHFNINTIYLAQSLIKVPKNCIRTTVTCLYYCI